MSVITQWYTVYVTEEIWSHTLFSYTEPKKDSFHATLEAAIKKARCAQRKADFRYEQGLTDTVRYYRVVDELGRVHKVY